MLRTCKLPRVPLGNTGLIVTRLCFGGLTVGPLQANLTLAEGARVIRYALERGINFIDTAEFYQTYPYIREALRGFAGEVIITSKSYAHTAEMMEKSLRKALRALNREVIDIFLLHEQESILTIRGHWEALEFLVRAKEKGYVRAVGISTHHIAAVRAAADIPEIEVVHPLLNRAGIGIADGTAEEMAAAIADLANRGKGIYGMKPLGGGHLIGDVPGALSYVLENPHLHAIAVGMKTTDEVDINLAYFTGQAPAPELVSRVRNIPRRLLIESWCAGCGTCTDHCSTDALAVVDGKATVDMAKCALCGYCGAYCPNFCIKIV